MLYVSVNMAVSGNIQVRKAIERLGATLPPDWIVTPASNAVDVSATVASPDGRAALLLIQAKQQLSPRDALELARRRASEQHDKPLIVAAPFLSPATRERLREARIGYVDQTGNAYLELSTPGLFVLTHGANVNPSPKRPPSRSLRGAKAAQLVRALVASKAVPGVRELAERVGTDPGYVSRLLALLDREALIERGQRGRVTRVDWQRLLRRWADDSPLNAREEISAYLEPRGLDALLKKLGGMDGYALSGSIVASRFAPVAPARLALVYADGTRVTPEALGLRPAPSGANVLWIEPKDPQLLQEATPYDGLRLVPLSQAVVDLLASPGRGPAEAEALLAWMGEHEDEWRR